MCDFGVCVLVIYMCLLVIIGMLLMIVCSDGIYSIVWFGVGLFRLINGRCWFFSCRVLLFSICGIMMCVGMLVFIFGF